MYLKGFTHRTRPPFFHDSSYEPGFTDDNAWSGANLVRDHITDLRSWIYDRLVIHGQADLRNQTRSAEFFDTLNTAREYDRTTLASSPFHTIVTHLYVCELLAKTLLFFFDQPKPHTHGYKWDDRVDIFSAAAKGSEGMASALHRLFYATALPDITGNVNLPHIDEFMRFLPELKGNFPGIDPILPLSLSCTEDWGATGAHPGGSNETYHAVHIEDPMLSNPGRPHGHTDLSILFPELRTTYRIASNYSSIPLSSQPMADQLISTSHDINGSTFALGFGGSSVPKMRDLEIRYYLAFVLGSIARYDAHAWNNLQQTQPLLYFKIIRFLEHNQIMFPLLILRYLSGRTYSFVGRSVFH